jgi:uncharacterized protein (TIGR02145 family)
MKAIVQIGLWKAIAFLTIILFSFSSCNPNDDPNPPVPPVDTLVKAIVAVRPAINIKRDSATLVGMVIPNQKSTSITFDYRLSTETVWQSQTLANTFSGSDSIRVTANVTNLKIGSEYTVRLRASNQAGEVTSITTNTFTTYAVSDADGNLYHTVKIGNQVWLQESFKGTHFANGDVIPNITDQSAWDAAVTPAYCWYNNDSSIGKVYGGLYNFYTASDPRGLIVGFHTPSDDEFITLAKYLGGNEVAGGKMKEAGYAHWIQPNVGATNSSGFDGLPSGAYQNDFGNGGFGHLGDGVGFWSATPFGIGGVASVITLGQSSGILQIGGGCYCFDGFSIRLMQN